MSESRFDGATILSSKTKKNVLKFIALGTVVIIAIAFVRSTDTHKLAEEAQEPVQLGMEDNLLSDDVFTGFTEGLKEQDHVINDVNRRINNSEVQYDRLRDKIESLTELFSEQMKNGTLPTTENTSSLPNLPDLGNQDYPPPPSDIGINIKPITDLNTSSNIGTKIEFQSEWMGERVCKRCKSSATWRQG